MEVLNEQTVKGYELKECLGEGAYGAVYRALQPQVGREVAIKVILPEFANRPEFIRRFEAEAQLVAQLEHMNIVPLYDYWREPDGAYLVMRLMKGGSLADSLQKKSAWEPLKTVRLVDQIAAALDAAHQQGVVHRDLKPANILLDENSNAYLSDFGIAKELGAEVGLTQTGAIVGTPAYITPEQVQSQAITPQTDIYALGVVLYELLTGEHPFADASTGTVIVKHVSEPLPLARGIRPELPIEVDEVIQKATAKDPASRYPDALAMATEFRRALQLEVALPAVPESEIYNPYKGLRAFQEADADDFFGRDALTGQLLTRLVQTPTPSLPLQWGGSNFLAVVGPSGSGKSSVVKAGLLPALRKGGLPGSERWFIVEMVPGAHPFEELEIALLRVAVNPPASLLSQMMEDKRGLLRAVKRTLPSDEQELLLLVDQFEETFTLVEDASEAKFFMDSLYAAVTEPRSQVRVIITLRADFYDRPLMHPDFSRLVDGQMANILPLTPQELEQAIRAPAERVGVLFEKGLVPAITADVVDQPGALPLLQYALTELFERREGRMLTHSAYQSIGGVLGALGRRAEEIYASLEEQGKQSARQVFLRLVALGEGTEDTRRRVLQAELEGLSSGQGIGDRGEGAVISDLGSTINNQQSTINNVIDIFGRARLLTFDHDPATRGATVEVAHEALLREWRRLREWFDESRADVRMQRVLANTANEWLEADLDPGFLLRGSRLDQFEGWSATTDLALTQAEGDYLDASLAERRAREAAEAQRRQRELEQVSVGLASQALLELEGASPERSVLLALEALEHYPYTWQAERALGQAVLNSRLRLVLCHDDTVKTAQWSADGSKILSCGLDRTGRVWDAFSGEELMSITEGAPNLASWSPDERFILAVNIEEIIVKVWHIGSGLSHITLVKEDIGADLSINQNGWDPWSPSGDCFVIYDKEGTLKIWDAETGISLHTLDRHQGSLSQALWSPNGELIASSGWEDGQVTIWEALTGDLRFSIEGGFEDGHVKLGDWSPSGDHFTTIGLGGVKVYDTTTGQQCLNLSVPAVYSWRVTWSPDGTRLLSTGRQDGTARLWDAESGQELDSISGLVQGSCSDWSRDGSLTAVGGHDSMVHLWDMMTGREILKLSGTVNAPWHLAFSPDGERLLTLGDSCNVNVYDLSEARINIPLIVYGGISNPTWSPDGDQFAFSVGYSSNYSLMIWDATRGEKLIEIIGISGDTIAWSPSGDNFLSPDDKSNSVRIFNAATWEQAHKFTGPEDLAGRWLYADWSPDGSMVASNNYDPSIVIWVANTGDEIITFSGHQDQVLGIAWSPDGTRILSNATQGEAMIWEAASGQLLHKLFPDNYNRDLSHGAWTKDGRRVVILSEDGNVTIFDSLTGEQRSQFFTTSSASLITDFSLSPSDERIIIGGHDGVARVWDLASGTQLLGYEVGGYTRPVYSPDGKWVLIGTNEGNEGKLLVYPAWHSTAELIAYAWERCVFRQLTAEERALFGLPERG